MVHTMLHVEDDPSLAKLVKLSFDSFGFKGEILTAVNVREALATLEELERLRKPLHLILTDMQLPDGTGLEVIKAVRSAPAWRLTPVVVLSGEKAGSVINDSYAIGANCYLPKFPRTKPILGILKSFYECWLESAVLPEKTHVRDRPQAILNSAVSFRARNANVYLKLSQAFANDPVQMEFWLDRALNEGNFSNLIVFLQSIFGEGDMSQGAIDRLVQGQARIDATLHAAEQFLEENPRPAVDASLAKVLDIIEALEENIYAVVFDQLRPLNPAVAEVFQSALVDHFTKTATFIAEQAELPSLRERAIAFSAVANKLNTICPS